jgi:hypothetical protein
MPMPMLTRPQLNLGNLPPKLKPSDIKATNAVSESSSERRFASPSPCQSSVLEPLLMLYPVAIPPYPFARQP